MFFSPCKQRAGHLVLIILLARTITSAFEQEWNGNVVSPLNTPQKAALRKYRENSRMKCGENSQAGSVRPL